VSPSATQDDPVIDVNNDETVVHDNICNTVAHDANDTIASESPSFNDATVLRRSSRAQRLPDRLTY